MKVNASTEILINSKVLKKNKTIDLVRFSKKT